LQERIIRILKYEPSVFFVQVGSNDGLQGDPIHEFIMQNKSWSGIFIEPVRFLFERLRQNYQNADRFIFENVAISTEIGKRNFYYVSEKAKSELGSALPYWHDQLGSFDRNHIAKTLDGMLEPYIVEEEIECVPLEQVLDRNQVITIDLLHIDTEGFDYKVLSQLNLKKYHPLIILFEHNLLSPDELEKARSLLKNAGYKLFEYGADTLALSTRRRTNPVHRGPRTEIPR